MRSKNEPLVNEVSNNTYLENASFLFGFTISIKCQPEYILRFPSTNRF